jgi:2-dehydro-3-deoxyphosphogluconate aldolase/(4S)-4-hydroxy-2-oxoglutarate aldolase
MLRRAPVVPVITIRDIDHAVPLARALVGGGLPLLEITLRTEHGLEAMRRIRAEVEGVIVGAGTVLNGKEFELAQAAGAEFIVSPGITTDLLQAAERTGTRLLPGVATVSEIMQGLQYGLETFKFFPAEAAGGIPMLRAFAGPFPRLRFCPTGGIGPDNAPAYLALDNVICVGGSWLTPEAVVQKGDWQTIGRLAREAAKLTRPSD